MTSRQQTWFALIAIFGPFIYIYATKDGRKLEVKERLEACFKADPKSAARYYSPRTPHDDKVAILEACIPERAEVDEVRDVNRYGR